MSDASNTEAGKQPVIEIYTTRLCPYCVMAKQLLAEKAVGFTEIAVDNDPEARQKMQQRSGGYTVPQIFINNHAIGGCDDLYRLDASGQLTSLLTPTQG